MMDEQGLELTDGERALAKRIVQRLFFSSEDFLRHTGTLITMTIKLQAMGDRAEFKFEHRECGYNAPMMTTYGVAECADPRHTWTAAQWIEGAQEGLSK